MRPIRFSRLTDADLQRLGSETLEQVVARVTANGKRRGPKQRTVTEAPGPDATPTGKYTRSPYAWRGRYGTSGQDRALEHEERD